MATEQINPTTAKLFNKAREIWVRSLGQGATLSVLGNRIHLKITASQIKRLAKVFHDHLKLAVVIRPG